MLHTALEVVTQGTAHRKLLVTRKVYFVYHLLSYTQVPKKNPWESPLDISKTLGAMRHHYHTAQVEFSMWFSRETGPLLRKSDQHH